MSEKKFCGEPWGRCPVRSKEQRKDAPHVCRVQTDGSPHRHNCGACMQVQR